MSTAEEKLLTFDGSPSFGGPSKIEVVTDIGLSGKRGSYFFFSNGDPNDSTVENKIIWATFVDPEENNSRVFIPSQKFNISVQRYDVCISIKSNDPSFLKVYHFSDGEEGTRWYEILSVSPAGISTVIPATFSSGQFSLSIPGQVAPSFLGELVAIQSVQPLFDLDLYLSTLADALKNILNFQINIQYSNPTALTTLPNPAFPSPVILSYDTSSTEEYSADLSSTAPNLITLKSGDTKNLLVGEKLTKNGGDGIFGNSPIITKILSNTAFEVSSSHNTPGEITFEANPLKISLFYLVRASELLPNGAWQNLNSAHRLHLIVGVGQLSL
jgi:hypothetical protein